MSTGYTESTNYDPDMVRAAVRSMRPGRGRAMNISGFATSRGNSPIRGLIVSLANHADTVPDRSQRQTITRNPSEETLVEPQNTPYQPPSTNYGTFASTGNGSPLYPAYGRLSDSTSHDPTSFSPDRALQPSRAFASTQHGRPNTTSNTSHQTEIVRPRPRQPRSCCGFTGMSPMTGCALGTLLLVGAGVQGAITVAETVIAARCMACFVVGVASGCIKIG